MNLREAAQMALQALQESKPIDINDPTAFYRSAHAIEALRAALAQPEQEPTRSQKLRDAGYTRRPKGWGKDEEEPEPVAWGFQNTGITGSNRWMYLKETIPKEDQYRGVFWTPLYTAPQREWQGLMDKEILADDVLRYHFGLSGGVGPVSKKGKAIVAAVEAKLKEKNS